MASFVRVIQLIGEVSFPRATASLFEDAILTVTSIDTDEEIRAFSASEWESCTVYDDGHYPLHAFQNTTLDKPARLADRRAS